MKRICLLVLVLSALALGQNLPITTSQVIVPVTSTNPQPALGATIQRVGNPGNTTYYYWIVTNYTVGNASPAGPFLALQSADTLSGSRYNQIVPQLPGTQSSFDVLRTSSPIVPAGACNCAVATAQTSAIVNDQSNSLSSYTVSTINIASLTLSLTNEVQSAGVSHLILRNFFTGSFISDLSNGGGGGGGGTPGGTPGQVQWNNAGIFGGIASTAVSGGTITIQSGGSIGVSGTGSITATAFSGILPNGNGGTGAADFSFNGTSHAVLGASLVSGTSVFLCTDSNGNATTSSCPALNFLPLSPGLTTTIQAVNSTAAINFMAPTGAANNFAWINFLNNTGGNILNLQQNGTLTVGTGSGGTVTTGNLVGSTLSVSGLTGIPKANGSSVFTAAAFADVVSLWTTGGVCNSSTVLFGDGHCAAGGGGGGGPTIQTNGTNNASQSTLNFINSTANAIGLAVTASNPTSGNQQFEITGTLAVTAGGTGLGAISSNQVLVGSGSNVFTAATLCTSNVLSWNGTAFSCPAVLTNPFTTLGQTFYSGAGGTLTVLNGPTSPNGVPQTYVEIPSAGAATAPIWTLAGVPVNAQTGTTYTIAVTDRTSVITAKNASSQTYTAVNPSTSGFGSNFAYIIDNIGAGNLTESASGFTINGGSTLAIPSSWAGFHWSDNTNYFVARFPDFTAFPNSPANSALRWNSSTGNFTNLANITIGPGSSTSGDIPKFADTTGLLLADGYGVQGTDTKLITSGTISGTSVLVCTDALGGLTTVSCPSGGGGATLQTNSVNNSSQSTLNLINSAATNGLTFTFTNTTAGTVQIGFTGTLNNAGLTNTSITVNGHGCTLGNSCAVTGGTVTYTANQTASSSDDGKLVIMNCSSACAYTLPNPQPSANFYTRVESQGSTLATIALGSSITFNGSTSIPVLNGFRALTVYANSATATDYSGDAPLIGGTNVTLTAASNGLTIAATAGGGGVASVSGDGALITNVNSVSAVTLTLGNAGAHTVWGNTSSSSATPAYTASPSLTSVILNGSTSGSTTISASATGGTLNLGSTSATVDGSGNLTVTSCTGCGGTSSYKQETVIYSGGSGCNVVQNGTGLTSPQTICSFNLATNEVGNGQVVTIDLRGNFTTGAANNAATWDVVYGSGPTTLCTSASTSLGNGVSNRGFNVHCEFTPHASPGSSVTTDANGDVKFFTAASATTSLDMANSSTITLGTNATTPTVAVRITFATSQAQSDTITPQIFRVARLN